MKNRKWSTNYGQSNIYSKDKEETLQNNLKCLNSCYKCLIYCLVENSKALFPPTLRITGQNDKMHSSIELNSLFECIYFSTRKAS